MGQLSGSVTDKGGQPIEDASIVIYKYGGLISSVDIQGGYTTITSSDKQGMYSFGALPSGVYNIKITYLNEILSTIDNYAVWHSSSLSFNFVK
jgi:protocatechuate 3,4-dioxygenase beta subunit